MIYHYRSNFHINVIGSKIESPRPGLQSNSLKESIEEKAMDQIHTDPHSLFAQVKNHPKNLLLHHVDINPTHVQLRAQKTDEATSTTTPIELNPVHVVFSTDCSFYQDWQSMVIHCHFH